MLVTNTAMVSMTMYFILPKLVFIRTVLPVQETTVTRGNYFDNFDNNCVDIFLITNNLENNRVAKNILIKIVLRISRNQMVLRDDHTINVKILTC